MLKPDDFVVEKITNKDVQKAKEQYGVSLVEAKRILEKQRTKRKLNHLIEQSTTVKDLKVVLNMLVEEITGGI